jgi:hypothetical protein
MVMTWLATTGTRTRIRTRTRLRKAPRTALRTAMQTMREQRRARVAMAECPPAVQMVPLWTSERHDGL